MFGNQLLLELIKIMDMKIDLVEYVIEKIVRLSTVDQREFVKNSSTFDRIDWLNMEFLSNYQKFLKIDNLKDLSQINTEKYPELRDLKHLVGYALELESSLETILKKL